MLRLRQPSIDSPRMKWAWGFGIAGFLLTLTIFGVILAAPFFIIAGILGMQERMIQKRKELSEPFITSQKDPRSTAQMNNLQEELQQDSPTDTDVIDAEWTIKENAPV